MNRKMNIFMEAYARSIAENEKQRIIWDNYLTNLKNLNISIFANKLKVPSLIPIGSRIFFRGDLIHTNEITVSLGSNYFVKCSASQAEIIKQHRIKGAEEKLQILKKERDYLENQLLFSQKEVMEESGKEIIEPYNHEEETQWRIKHRENIRKHKQEESRDPVISKITDDELWERLEELELKEELENEYDSPAAVTAAYKEKPHTTDTSISNLPIKHRVEEVKSRLSQINTKEKLICSTEEDIFKRLEELEEQEELEEELDRLQDDDDSDLDNNDRADNISKTQKKTVSFASDHKQDCLEINFKHSDISPIFKEYNKADGILKPSDIYVAFPGNFKDTSIIPILKKTEQVKSEGEMHKASNFDISKVEYVQQRPTNVVGEVIENADLVAKQNKIIETADRPPSKFKAMRMQKFS